MINKEDITAIETVLTLPAGTLEAAIKDEKEVKISLPELVAFKKSDYEIRMANIEKAKYDEGKLAGSEMPMKKLKELSGIDIEGYKDPEKFITAFRAKVEADAKIEPSEKIKALQGDFEQMKANWQAEAKAKADLEAALNNTKKEFRVNEIIRSSVPEKTIFSNSNDLAILFKSSYQIDFDETGKEIVKDAFGNVIKHKDTLEPKAVKEVIGEWATVNKYIKVEGGAGGGDEGGNGKTGIEAFIKEMEAKGINQGSFAFNEEMAKRQKAGTL